MALVRRHADVNVPEPDGTTPLHWAVYHNAGELVDALIKASADANAVNRYGVTPLSLACRSGSDTIVARLLVAGAHPDTPGADGETPLMSAARGGSVAAVKLLLARKVPVDTREEWRGQTALMWAAADDNADVAQALLDAGADLHARSRAGFTPLLYASRAGPDGASPLLLAGINAKYELAATLLDYGADPNADGPGWTALHQIAWTRRPHVGFNNPEPVHNDGVDGLELVRTLIDFGANPNAHVKKELKEEPRIGLNGLNLTGATPFLLAAKNADVDLMRVLAEKGADPLMANEDGTTPLMVAAGVGIFTPGEDPGTNEEALEAVKLALALGGSVTTVDKKGDTALHGAASRGANALVRFLVERGGKLDVKNRRGWTPLIIADGVILGGTFKRQPETAALIRELVEAGRP
jgi:ankyrin repeat protein